MIRSLSTASTGMSAQQANLDNIAHNIANVNTTSFKRGMINFEDLLYQTETIPGAMTSDAGTALPSGIQYGLGVAVDSLYKSHEQGSLLTTPGVELNVALDGIGFFQVTRPDGTTAYTRDGAFQLDSTGQIVNSQGYPIVPGITLPDNTINVTITQDGKVQANVNNILQDVGQFEMVRFVNPAGLMAIGGNMYLETEASAAPISGFAGDLGYGLTKQYFLESSNVNSIVEITDMIKCQRAFESNSKVIQVSEQMLKTIIDTKA